MDGIKKFFGAIWAGWKKFGQFMGDMIGRLVLMILYLTVVLPFGLGSRFFSDRLEIRKGIPASWRERTPRETTIEASYEQF